MYYTIDCAGSAEFIVDKSRFIGHITPIKTEEEALRFIEKIKKEHNTATHNVPIYLIGEKFDVQRYSDDGEPSGTTGVPVLEMLKKRNITNLCIVITRYFGGIKLGTGGLVRAYTHAAQIALDEVGVKVVDDFKEAIWQFDYTYYEKINHVLEDYFHKVIDTRFTDRVELEILLKYNEYSEVLNKLIEISSNRIAIIKEDDVKRIV